MRTLLAVAFLFVAACDACTAVTPPPKPPAPPPGPATIAGACDRGRMLGCSWAEPTAAGAPCEEVIAEDLASGVFAIDLACVASIGDCSEEAACARNP